MIDRCWRLVWRDEPDDSRDFEDRARGSTLIFYKSPAQGKYFAHSFQRPTRPPDRAKPDQLVFGPMDSRDHGSHLQWEAVFDDEIGQVRARRTAVHRASAEPADQNLVGLAFSGGGIRSATFGLGILEGLKQCSRLKKIDYLSTV